VLVTGTKRVVVILFLVGGLTAVVPGAASLKFGGQAGKALTSLGAAGAAGSGGSVLNQKLQGNTVDHKSALISGASNTIGLGMGKVLEKPARYLATFTIPGSKGFTVKSLTGRTFTHRARNEIKVVNQTSQQLIQDSTSAVSSKAIESEFEDSESESEGGS